MKKIILLIALLSISNTIITSQIQQKFIAERTVIAGSVVNNSNNAPNILTVLFCDPTIDSKNLRNVFRVSENKDFHAAANVFFTQNTTIKYGNEFYNFLISPGDSIYIKIDPAHKEIDKRIVFSGDNAKLNNQFTPFVNYLYTLTIPHKIDLSKGKEETLSSYKNYLNTIRDSIKSYANRHTLMPAIIEWAERDAIYILANQIFKYSAQQSELVSDSIFQIFNPDNFKSMYFSYHLDGYLYSLLRKNENYNNINPNDFKAKIEILLQAVNKMPQGISRDYIIYSYITNLIATSNANIDSEIFNLFSNDYFVTRIKEQIDKNLNTQIKSLNIPIKGISYLNAKNKIQPIPYANIFDILKTKAKGKVIYIDIYATWCGPCRAEIPAAKTLRDQYKNNNVEFVYLCLGSNSNDWQRLISKEFIACENYFFDTSATDAFLGQYSHFVKGYPTFVIIDKKGNLITKGVPRPSNVNQIIKLIDNLLQD
ncbi:MAG: TlpA disulfide reductase family protein [Muribaculaceae bacterium]|nr:TlpA disulfide reductase family protein [Muribaculaceae bacterium]